MMNEEVRVKITVYALKLADHTITPEEFEELNSVLSADSQAARHYNCIMMAISDFRERGKEIIDDEVRSESVLKETFWNEMSEYEKTAPEVEILHKKPQNDLIQKVIYPPREKRKVTKFSIFMITNAAAIILFLLFIKFMPPKSGTEVATLMDTINADWSDRGSFMQKGSRLVSNSELMLREGIAEFLFDNQTRVVVEAPAEFEILANDRIGMAYGRVYVVVSKEAIGFSVYTPNSKIIDMGTEFGVQADISGNTELYVIKGKTLLMTGDRARKANMEVNEGAAKKVSGVDSAVADIEYVPAKFVRRIDSAHKQIWRGENLSLASIVAGHNGFQKVDSLVGLNPVNGKYTASVVQKNRNTNGIYNLVTDSDFIDGVFVPDGQSGPIQISSSGHTFDCPDTSGIFTHEIAVYKGSIENQHTTIPPVMVDDREVVKDPVLMLHSNTGITFNLQAIRDSLPQLDLKSFKATGLPMKEFSPDIDFWILVDGELKYEKKIVEVDRDPVSLNIEFSPQDRFLTLIVTDGLRATDNERKDACSSDFYYLISPELNLEERP